MRRFLRENSLSLFFLAIFLGALAGQAIAGHTLSTASSSPTAIPRSRSAAT
jgi:hypothetical protein